MDIHLLDYIEKGYCVALIPARGGSKSVPGKNIRLFQGHPLIAYSIAAAELAQDIDRVIVSTDCAQIAQIAVRYGAEVPFLRPKEYAGDDSPDIEFVEHAVKWMYDHENRIPEYLVHLRPTTPIRDTAAIHEALDMIRQDKNATSLRSGSVCIHPPYKWLKKEGEYLSPLIPGMTCDETNIPRQDFPEVYIPNGYVDIIKTEFVIRSGLLHGDRMLVYKTEEVPDIDTEWDLKKMELYSGLREAAGRLQDYLNGKVNKC